MKAGALFIGSFLIFLGLFFLAINFGFPIPEFSGVITYWPILLIVWGVALLKINNIAKLVLATLSGIMLAFLLGSIYISISNKFMDINIDKTINITKNKSFLKSYEDSFIDSIKFAELDFSGGVGQFQFTSVGNTGFKIVSYHASSDVHKEIRDSTIYYSFSGTDTKSGDSKTMEILLGQVYVWDLHLKTGASNVKLDFKDVLLKNLNINAGASDFNITLGNLSDSNIEINSGAANFEIWIPRDAGCKIITRTTLSSTQFKDFISTEQGVFYTEDYDDWKQKITITIDGALSNFDVKKY